MQTLNLNNGNQPQPPSNGYQNGNGTAGRAPKVLFDPNTPLTLAVRYTDGKEVDSQFGGSQIMFTLCDGRVMFVPPIVRDEMARLGIQAGEEFVLTKSVKGSGRSAQTRWLVDRADSLPGQLPPPTQPPPPTAQTAPPRPVPFLPPAPAGGAVEYEDALEAFLVKTGRATMRAQKVLGGEGCHVTFTEESIQKMATTALIQAARSGLVTWEGRRL